MKKHIFLITFLLITACGPSQEELQATVQASIAETQMAIPTFTPIPSFSKLDIQGILIQPGDLPSNYEAGQIKYDWPVDHVPMKVKPANFILQMFKEKGDSINIPHFSMLALYDNIEEADDTYLEIVKSNYGLELSAVQFERIAPPLAGEKNSILYYAVETNSITFNGTLIIFQRCNAIVLIQVYEWKDNELFAYAKGIDKRVEKISCR